MRSVLLGLLIIAMVIVCINCRDRSCLSDKACLHNECCKSGARVRGKRSVYGTCTPKGTLGTRCYRGGLLYYGSPPLLLSCPCADGFQCNVNGPRNPPQGEQGVCGPE